MHCVGRLTVSATPMCSSGACVALSCYGGSYSVGAYGSLWGALPMKGITPFISSSTKRTLGVSACSLPVQLLRRICSDNHNYFQFKLKGKGRSASGSDPWLLFVDCWLGFLGPCTQVHGQGFPPPSGRGRGGGDAGSLLPGVLPPN